MSSGVRQIPSPWTLGATNSRMGRHVQIQVSMLFGIPDHDLSQEKAASERPVLRPQAIPSFSLADRPRAAHREGNHAGVSLRAAM